MIILKAKLLLCSAMQERKRRDGSKYSVYRATLNDGQEDNIVIELPAEYKMPQPDKDGIVEIQNVFPTADVWNVATNRFDRSPIIWKMKALPQGVLK